MTDDIKILGTDWKFETTNDLPHEWMLGHMDACQHKISLKGDAFPSWRLYLLLHEVLHALTFMGHLQFLRVEGDGTAHDDEAKVDAIASLLADFLLTNKTFIDKLVSEDYDNG